MSPGEEISINDFFKKMVVTWSTAVEKKTTEN